MIELYAVFNVTSLVPIKFVATFFLLFFSHSYTLLGVLALRFVILQHGRYSSLRHP